VLLLVVPAELVAYLVLEVRGAVQSEESRAVEIEGYCRSYALFPLIVVLT